jgi:hypothetical protein
MTNLLQNPGFELDYSFWNITPAGGTIWQTITTLPHSGTKCSRTTIPGDEGNGGFARQSLIPLTSGSMYTVSCWYRAVSTPGTLNILTIDINQVGGPSSSTSFDIGNGVDIGVWKQASVDFVGGTSVTVSFIWSRIPSAVSPNFIADLDDTFLGLAPVPCFMAGSSVLCQNENGEYSLPIEDIVEKKTIVKTRDGEALVQRLVISGPTSRLALIRKNLLGEELPYRDLVTTYGHGIMIDGKEIKAVNIPGAVRLQARTEMVYTPILSKRSTIFVNGIEVAADGEKEYQRFLMKKHW